MKIKHKKLIGQAFISSADTEGDLTDFERLQEAADVLKARTAGRQLRADKPRPGYTSRR